MNSENTHKFDYQAMLDWAIACLQSAGASAEVARTTAYYLLEGDMLGYRTHGLVRLYDNMRWLRDGKSRTEGEVTVVSDRPAIACWDAGFLPGPYVMPKAIQVAIDKAKQCGTGTMLLRRSQHVASLAAYLSLATEQQLLISVMASSPGQRAVTAHGGKQAVFSPNPFAIGVPTSSQALIFDISLSMTAAGKVRQAKANGQRLPYAALVTADGEWSDDPHTFFAENASAIAPLGGAQLGYKGYGLTLFSEIWSMALSLHGRQAGADDGDANSVWIQVIDPAAIGDYAAFQAVTDELLQAALNSAAIDPPVRLPGQQSHAHKQRQLRHGVEFSDAILRVLQRCADDRQLPLPAER
ncbi:Ldh family oxidoreductase [Idiomarina xiamenensis]|uniref:Malate/L-lactate dehydrogenase n=1 Tax=Idiomarina xiamenensis 10-D-4 TaxID=740709 RepID=K2KSC0_9GAMM|nr:Ldh family oxidoreductase [Idiomarina xiamenensis]EKE80500.1 malate/L-lactate dehydrogenase [Idiomarina xiamenensis 10-D-4]